MTAYLRPGDRIMLAAPDFWPGVPVGDDLQAWRDMYATLGVHVEHVAVHHALTHPVVVAVLRAIDNPAEGDPA